MYKCNFFSFLIRASLIDPHGSLSASLIVKRECGGIPRDYLHEHTITHTLIVKGCKYFTTHEKFPITGHHHVIRHGQYPL